MQIIDQYIDRFKPALQSAGQSAMVAANRIIARLDTLIEAVEDRDPRERVHRGYFSLPGVVGENVELIRVPTGRVGEMDIIILTIPSAISGAPLGADQSFNLVEGPNYLRTFGTDGSGFTYSDADFVAKPMHLPSATVISMVRTQGAVPAQVFVQWREFVPRRQRRAQTSGLIEVGATGAGPTESQDRRHETEGIFAGTNVVGERREQAPSY